MPNAAQQVIATAVSKAAVLSKTNTTITEIANELGLKRHMIGKCQARYDAITDGEWEELFDDAQVSQSCYCTLSSSKCSFSPPPLAPSFAGSALRHSSIGMD